MKKLFLFATTSLLLNFSSHAQMEEGDYLIGGSTGFMFHKLPASLSDNYTINFNLSPTVGRFLTSNLLLEGSLSYRLIHQRTNNGSTLDRVTSHGVGGGVSVTRYFSLSNNLYFTLGGFLSADVQFSVVKSPFGTTSSDIYGATIGATPGLTYFLNDHWAIFTNLGALSFDVNNIASASREYRVGYDLSTTPITFGAKYLLKSKK